MKGCVKMKELYFMRHSQAIKTININNSDSLQLQNEKWCLTADGEKLAKEKSQLPELQNFDVVISSNYVRAMDTAKYFTNEKIYIDEGFGERKFGIDSWDELPENFGSKQFNDFNYKTKNGESLNEVLEREICSLNNILNNMNNKKVLIVGHSTAGATLLSKWCEIHEKAPYKFNNKEFFDGNWNHCETFKLTFNEDNELIDIINVR